MDKRKVIQAYRRGFVTMQECAQILGIDSNQIAGMIREEGEEARWSGKTGIQERLVPVLPKMPESSR